MLPMAFFVTVKLEHRRPLSGAKSKQQNRLPIGCAADIDSLIKCVVTEGLSSLSIFPSNMHVWCQFVKYLQIPTFQHHYLGVRELRMF